MHFGPQPPLFPDNRGVERDWRDEPQFPLQLHFIKSKCDKKLREKLSDRIAHNNREGNFAEGGAAGAVEVPLRELARACESPAGFLLKKQPRHTGEAQLSPNRHSFPGIGTASPKSAQLPPNRNWRNFYSPTPISGELGRSPLSGRFSTAASAS